MSEDQDKDFERLMTLLDVCSDQVKRGDGRSALMAAEEALKTAQRMAAASKDVEK